MASKSREPRKTPRALKLQQNRAERKFVPPYTESDKVAALSLLTSNGNNVLATSRMTGIPRMTLKLWADGGGINRAVTAKRQGKESELADLFEEAARLHLANMTKPGKVRKANARDSAVIAGISIDKMRLLREQPTSIRAGEGSSAGPTIQVFVVPSATDPGGRVYSPAELAELSERVALPSASAPEVIVQGGNEPAAAPIPAPEIHTSQAEPPKGT